MKILRNFLFRLLFDGFHELLLRILLVHAGNSFEFGNLTADVLLDLLFHFAEICKF